MVRHMQQIKIIQGDSVADSFSLGDSSQTLPSEDSEDLSRPGEHRVLFILYWNNLRVSALTALLTKR